MTWCFVNYVVVFCALRLLALWFCISHWITWFLDLAMYTHAIALGYTISCCMGGRPLHDRAQIREDKEEGPVGCHVHLGRVDPSAIARNTVP